jgi:3-hydroxyisobutyrate dehydrogenase
MLPATQHVASTLSGPNGVLANARPGTLIIDSSTIDPVACKSMHEQVRSAGMRMLDAPVSGGVGGAEAGTLTFMVGGDATDLARGKHLLDLMGKNIVHCGDGGAGEVAKLCNNLALAIQMVGVSEAMALGVRMGIDPKVLAGVMNTSTGRSWSSDTYNPCPGVMPNVPSSRGYTGGFAVALMEKDLGLALDAGRQSKTRLPLGSAAGQLYGLLLEHGYGGKDFSSVFEFITKSGGPKA